MGSSGEPDAEAYLRALGKRVRILRLTRELTQEELAAASGMSRNFVSLIEHGAHGVDVVRLLRLAAALGVPLEELLRDPGTDRPSERD
jgi:XRE family transcriptional regulator, aerobic/anaerobic benzoate catabolism transcriptional regulator